MENMKKRISIITGLVAFFAIATIVLFFYEKPGFQEIQIKLEKNYSELFSNEELQNKISPIVEYTTENSIGFENVDGTKSLYIYANPIHFKDENGKWKKIDTRITNTTDCELRKRGYIYSVVANDIQSYFSKTISKESGFLLKNNTSFEFGIRSEKAINPQYKKIDNFIGDNKNMLIYKNIEDGTDIRLYPSSVGVNCEVVFNKNPEHNSLNFWVKVENAEIVLKKQEGGYINIVKENVHVNGDAKDIILGVIQTPLLKDNEGNISYKCNLASRHLGDNIYELVFTFESKYLDTGSTAFIAFEMRREKQPDNAIYSQRPELVNAYLKNYSVVGNSPDYGIGQLLIRYQFVNKFELQQDIIDKAQYCSYSLTKKMIFLKCVLCLKIGAV